jgi:GNAT superfamily N-acetyltransferase
MATRIRSANSSDVSTLFEVRCSVTENHMSVEALARIGITPESVTTMIVGDDSVVPIIEDDGRLVAFAIGQLSTGYVLAVFVRDGCERRGHGRRVLEHVEAGFRARGVTSAWLATSAEPTLRAHGFYRALGWTCVGAQADGQLRYEKNLS